MNRVAVVEQVYYQGENGASTPAVSRFSRWLLSDEQPWVRRLTLKDEWTPLDCGWLLEASMLSLQHIKHEFQLNPTPKEAEEAASEHAELGVVIDGAIAPLSRVPPGESLRLPNPCLANLRIRGKGRCNLVLTPC